MEAIGRRVAVTIVMLCIASAALLISPHPAMGSMDLRTDTSADGKQFVPLHGKWEFYWNELLEPGSFELRGIEPTYIEVPLSWRSQPAAVFSGLTDVRYGYGTYRLQMLLSPDDIGRSKALLIRSVGSAYRIWIDGKERPGLGIVGKERSAEKPQAHTNLIFIEPGSERMEIVMQVSNHSFREGGIISEIVFGDSAALIVYLLKKMFFDIFIIGGFALIGLFHLIVYGFRIKYRLTLLVGLVTLAISARTLIINGYLSRLLLGIDSWELLTKLEYIVENIGFLFLVLLIRSMYPQEVNRYVLYASCVIALALSAFVLLTPARIFTETMLAQTLVKAVILAYFVFYVGIIAYLRRREGAVVNLPAILAIVLAIVNDMLYYARLVNTIELFSFSALLFVLAQAIIVAYRYARLEWRNDALVMELGEMNATLEQRVHLRTRKLREANEQLSEMKDVRTKMLVNIAHDLNSPMTGVQSYLHLMDKGKIDRPDAVRQMVEKTDYIQRLIRDLFELAKLESGEQKFDIERVQASGWLEDIYRRFDADLEREQFTLQQGRWETAIDGTEMVVAIDRYRIMQVFQNYMDNAVKFSRARSSVITIHVFPEQHREDGVNHLVVEIADSGEGIAAEHLPHLFDRFYKKRTNNDRGSGLGLAIVAEIIAQHRGTVGARSEHGKGSVFYFRLPVA